MVSVARYKYRLKIPEGDDIKPQKWRSTTGGCYLLVSVRRGTSSTATFLRYEVSLRVLELGDQCSDLTSG